MGAPNSAVLLLFSKGLIAAYRSQRHLKGANFPWKGEMGDEIDEALRGSGVCLNGLGMILAVDPGSWGHWPLPAQPTGASK